MHITGFIYRNKWSFNYSLILSLCMAIFSSQLYAQSAEQLATNQALPSLNCDDFKQSIRRVYIMLTENKPYETIYQTITAKDSTFRTQMLNLIVIAHTSTFYNKGNDLETIVSTIDKNCGVANNSVVDKDLNIQCDMYVFLINEMARAQSKGAKSIDDLPIKWQQPLDSMDQKTADLTKFAMEHKRSLAESLLQKVLDNPQQTAEQLVDKFNKTCRYTAN